VLSRKGEETVLCRPRRGKGSSTLDRKKKGDRSLVSVPRKRKEKKKDQIEVASGKGGREGERNGCRPPKAVGRKAGLRWFFKVKRKRTQKDLQAHSSKGEKRKKKKRRRNMAAPQKGGLTKRTSSRESQKKRTKKGPAEVPPPEHEKRRGGGRGGREVVFRRADREKRAAV